MDLKTILGRNIKNYRQLNGLSQEDFSEMLGISQQTLSRIERGKNFLTSETLEKIPHILGVKTYELFLNDESYTTENVVDDIERYLKVIKTNPDKLSCVHKLIREITFL